MIAGTPHATSYAGAGVLIEEQKKVRWKTGPTKQPFWANYWCGKDKDCTCRIGESRSLESDAIFFFRNGAGRVLAVHVEFKHPAEPFQDGQPEGYPLRAKCFAETHHERKALNAHGDWTTVLFCGPESVEAPGADHFERVISHAEAAMRLAKGPK